MLTRFNVLKYSTIGVDGEGVMIVWVVPELEPANVTISQVRLTFVM